MGLASPQRRGQTGRPVRETVKNRMHFDLRPTDRTQDEEIERLRAIGATEVADHRGKYGPGTGWVNYIRRAAPAVATREAGRQDARWHRVSPRREGDLTG
ncbi:VOC family protein [Jiangella rhizosphaerae]|uniref:VOC family protein n=1 Tax=Jiangella rhizosphaerae TaxID=2293569 RepID=UPI00227758E0|nr:VOC family protein [Jiangella rhizosphaerae]